jgi:myo-inositol-1(or 4)-monophosphatase
MSLDLARCLEIATGAALQAGKLLQEKQKTGFQVKEKGRADLVTDVDTAAQQRIREMIHTAFPEHGFLGEESSAQEHERGRHEQRPQWIVDPIDGTVNYVHGFPMYAVSIALTVGPELQVGVIYDPSQEEIFQATRGGPALCNGQRMQTTKTAHGEEALLALGFSTKPEEQAWLQSLWNRFSLTTHGVRRTGSSALNMAYVAQGRVDVFCAAGIHAWDVAAGILLVEAAGGKVTDLQGQPFDMHRHWRILATNGQLHEQFVQELNRQGA